MKFYLKVIIALIVGGVYLSLIFDPPDKVEPLEKATLENYLRAMHSRQPVDFAVSFRHIRADGSKTDLLSSYWPDPATKQWYAKLETRLYGPGYLQWQMTPKSQKPPIEDPESTIYDSLLPPDTLKEFVRAIIDSGLFEIPLAKITYETRRVEHPVQKGRWYIGENWYWDDPNSLLCVTDSCRKANRGVWLSPTLEDLRTGRDFLRVAIGSGRLDIRWTTDRMDKDAPLAPNFQKIVQFVQNTLIPFAEKNYYDKTIFKGTKVIYVPTMGTPQRNLCFLYGYQVCGLPPGPTLPESATSG